MMRWGPSNNQTGFTLIELLAVVIILSVLTYISVSLFNSVKAGDQLRETRQRMDLLTAKIKQYYLTHQQLPKPIPEDGTGVPVEALDMEQKFRLDGWGQYLIYNPGDPNANGQYTNITNTDLEGKAALIESHGPDQKLDAPNDKDNIKVFVDVTAEAILITRQKLKVLQEKVAAYDALFAGIDNDGDGTVDNTDDVGKHAETTVFYPDNTCPPTHSFTNDPSEGLSTLDEIEKLLDVYTEPYDYNCQKGVVFHLVEFYGLPSGRNSDNEFECVLPGGYDCDPWNRPFKWGYEGKLRDDGDEIDKDSDPRYHRFYSSGPDVDDSQDDIIFSGN